MTFASEHEFVPKSITVTIWGMDAAMKPFTETTKTQRLAIKAVILDFNRPLTMGDLLGIGYKGKKSRFRVIQSFLISEQRYRVTLEDVGNSCLWEPELAEPDAVDSHGERRREPRMPIVGGAQMFNAAGTSSSGKLTDISRGGCYVETFAPSPVGTEMRLLLRLPGLEVEARAIVRVSHPAMGMGMEIMGFAGEDHQERFYTFLEGIRTQENA